MNMRISIVGLISIFLVAVASARITKLVTTEVDGIVELNIKYIGDKGSSHFLNGRQIVRVYRSSDHDLSTVVIVTTEVQPVFRSNFRGQTAGAIPGQIVTENVSYHITFETEEKANAGIKEVLAEMRATGK